MFSGLRWLTPSWVGYWTPTQLHHRLSATHHWTSRPGTITFNTPSAMSAPLGLVQFALCGKQGATASSALSLECYSTPSYAFWCRFSPPLTYIPPHQSTMNPICCKKGEILIAPDVSCLERYYTDVLLACLTKVRR